MAAAFVRVLFSGAQASSSSYACVLTASMAAGNFALIYVDTNNARTLGSISDSRGGNTYQKDDDPNSAPGTHLASTKPANALLSGDTVTIPITGGTSSGAVIIIEASGLHTSAWFGQAKQTSGASAGSGGSGSTATLDQADNLVIGIWGGGTPASTSFTPNAGQSWTTDSVATGTRELRDFYKVVSSTTAVAFDAAWAPNSTWSMTVGVYKAAASGAQTVTLGLIDQTAVINAVNVQSKFVTLAIIDQTAVPFAPQVNLTIFLGLVDQTAATFSPTVATTGTQPLTLGLITQTAAIFGVTVANSTPVTLGLIDRTAVIFGPVVTTLTTVTLGLITQTASILALVVDLGAPPFVPGVPRNRTGAIEYVVEIYDSSGTFGPGTKLGELWDARNLGWSKYDRLPGKGFVTLAQTSAMLPFIVPLTTHVAIYRVSSVADVLVYRGVAYDTNSTGDDVIVECFDYLALLSLSRAGFKTLYPTKKIGTEIASPEWAAAKSAGSSPLGFVTTGTIQDPLGTDGVTAIKTNAQFGTLDQMRLQLMYDLTEMGRANTVNQTTFEIDLTNTFNFWKNQNGTAASALVLGGNVSDYNYLPNWKRYRNNLATLGVAASGGPSEITSNNAGEVTAKGLRQDVTTLKTLAGIAGIATEADQQKAALDRDLKHLTQQPSTLMLRLLRERFSPVTDGWINDQIPVEIGNGSDSITGNRRIIGMQARYAEHGEDLNVMLDVVAS